MLPPVSLRVVIKITLRQIKPPRNPSFHRFRDTWPIPFSFLCFPLSLSLLVRSTRNVHQISYTRHFHRFYDVLTPQEGEERRREEGGTMKFSDDCRRISFYQTKVLKPAYLDPSSSISPVSLDGKNSPVNRESERKKNRKIFLFIFFFLPKSENSLGGAI